MVKLEKNRGKIRDLDGLSMGIIENWCLLLVWIQKTKFGKVKF